LEPHAKDAKDAKEKGDRRKIKIAGFAPPAEFGFRANFFFFFAAFANFA